MGVSISSILTATTGAAGVAPGAATSLTASAAQSNQVTLSWTAPAVGLPVTYQPQYRLTGTSAWTSYPTSGAILGTSVTITGLTPNASYDFQVITANGYGQATSATITQTTLGTAPAQPTNFAVVSSTTTTAHATWTPSASGVPTPSYVVTYRTPPGSGTFGNGTAPTSNNAVDVTGLTANTTYEFQLTATNTVGSVTATATATAKTLSGVIAPGAPTALTLGTVTGSSLQVSWTASATGSGSFTNTVQFAPSGTTTWATAGTTTDPTDTFTITHLPSGTAYDIRVLSANAAGAGPASATLTATTTSSGNVRDPRQNPGAASSMWLTPLGSGASWSGATDADTKSLQSLVGTVAGSQYGIPVYVSAASDPLVTFTSTSDGTRQRDAALTVSLHCPATAVPANPFPGGDCQMVIFDITTDPTKMWCFSQCSFVNGKDVTGGVTAVYGEVDLVCGSMEDALTGNFGINAGMGVIRASDLTNANGIQHGLRFCCAPSQLLAPSAWDVTTNPTARTLPSGNTIAVGATQIYWPQTHVDYNAATTYKGDLPGGVTVGIPSTQAMPTGLTAGGKLLWNNAQQYGWHWRGSATGGVTLYTEPGQESNSLIAGMRGDLATIVPYLRVLRNQGPNSIQGGGTPATTLPPSIDPAVCGALIAPGQVTGVSLNSSTTTSAALSWVQPTGSLPMTYVIQASAHGANAFTTTSATIYGALTGTLSGLTAGANLDFRVVATNAAGAGTPSAILTVQLPGTTAAAVTFDPTASSSTMTLSADHSTATAGAVAALGSQTAVSSTSLSAGKAYFEFVVTTTTTNMAFGLLNSSFTNKQGGFGADANAIAYYPISPLMSVYYNNAVLTENYSGSTAFTSGHTISMAVDLGAQLLWVTDPAMRAVYGAAAWNNSATANPATGAGGLSFNGMKGPYFIAFNDDDAGGVVQLNAGQSAFSVTLPSGFTAWGSSGGTTAPTVTVPAQPTGLATSAITATGVTVSWSAVAATGGTVSYLLESAPHGGTSWTAQGTTTGTSLTASGLTANTQYDFRITASDSAGSGAPSAVVTATTAAATTTSSKYFTVSGGQVLTPSGTMFVGRGVAMTDSAVNTWVTKSDCTPLLTLFPNTNIVRIAAFSYWAASTYSQVIGWLTAKNIVVVIENHQNFKSDGTSAGNAGGGANGGAVVLIGTALTTENNWYASLGTQFLNNGYVWFGTNNEPSYTMPTTNPPQTITGLAGLSNWQQATYNAIRGTGNNTIIEIEQPAGGNPNTMGSSNGLTASVYAAMTGIVAGPHFYPWIIGGDTNVVAQSAFLTNIQSTITTIQTITSKDGVVPVGCFEFGPSTVGPTMDTSGMASVKAVLQATDNGNLFCYIAWLLEATGYADDLLATSTTLSDPYGKAVAADILSNASSAGALVTGPLASTATAGTWTLASYNGLYYWWLPPANYDSTKSYCLLLYLHQNQQGTPFYTNGKSATSDLVKPQIDPWFNNTTFRTNHPCFVLAPLLDQSTDTSGNTINWGGVDSGQQASQTNYIGLVNYWMSAYPISKTNVYCTGNSMGGIGTWDCVVKYNDLTGTVQQLFAGYLILAGATYAYNYPTPTATMLQNLVSVPIWAIHGAQDTTVPLAWDQNVYTGLGGTTAYDGSKATKGQMRYTQDAGLGHDVWDTYYVEPKAETYWAWLFPQSAATGASPDNTIVFAGTGGSITDANGHVWAINSTGQITVDGATTYDNGGVQVLAYEGGKIYQENSSNLWWSKTLPTDSWSPPNGTATSPVPGAAATFTESPSDPGNYTTIATGDTASKIYNRLGETYTWVASNGGQVAKNGVVDASTSNVTQEIYYNHVLYWQQSGGVWFSTPGGPGAYAGPLADPRPAAGAGTRDPYKHPGGNGSVWNTPLGDGCTWGGDNDADTLDARHGGAINSYDNYGSAIWRSTSTSDPHVSFSGKGGNYNIQGQYRGNGTPLSTTAYCPNNSYSAGPYPGDNHYNFIDPNGNPGRLFCSDPQGNGIYPTPSNPLTYGSSYSGIGYFSVEDITSDSFGEDFETGQGVACQAVGLITGYDLDSTQNPNLIPNVLGSKGQGLTKIQHGVRYMHDPVYLKCNATPQANGDNGQGLLLSNSTTNAWPQLYSDYQSKDPNNIHNYYTGNLVYGTLLGIPQGKTMPKTVTTDAGKQLWWVLQNYGATTTRDVALGGFHISVDSNTVSSSWISDANNDLPIIVQYLCPLRNQHIGGQSLTTSPKNGPGNRVDSGPAALASFTPAVGYTPSPNYTTVVGSGGGSITDFFGVQWSITTGGSVAVKKLTDNAAVTDTGTNNVTKLAYVRRQVWHYGSNVWFVKMYPTDTWTQDGVPFNIS